MFVSAGIDVVCLQNANLAHYSSYPESALIPTANLMINYILKPIRHEAFHKKYAHKKYNKVSFFTSSIGISLTDILIIGERLRTELGYIALGRRHASETRTGATRSEGRDPRRSDRGGAAGADRGEDEGMNALVSSMSRSSIYATCFSISNVYVHPVLLSNWLFWRFIYSMRMPPTFPHLSFVQPSIHRSTRTSQSSHLFRLCLSYGYHYLHLHVHLSNPSKSINSPSSIHRRRPHIPTPTLIGFPQSAHLPSHPRQFSILPEFSSLL